MDEQRIIEIETRLAYQEQTLLELNEVITDQQAQLDKLARTADDLKARIRAIGSGEGGSDTPDERPPHY